jgi:hypothetical protein
MTDKSIYKLTKKNQEDLKKKKKLNNFPKINKPRISPAQMCCPSLQGHLIFKQGKSSTT